MPAHLKKRIFYSQAWEAEIAQSKLSNVQTSFPVFRLSEVLGEAELLNQNLQMCKHLFLLSDCQKSWKGGIAQSKLSQLSTTPALFAHRVFLILCQM